MSVPASHLGKKKRDCSSQFDALWCEIDLDASVSPDGALEAAVGRLEDANLGFFPSAIVFSGNRSPHLYFKLDESLPWGEIEDCNRFLADCLGGDKNVFNIDRVMRHPGSLHEKTDSTAEVLDFSGRVTRVAELRAVRPEVGASPRRPARITKRPVATQRSAEWRAAAEELGDWRERPNLDPNQVLTLANHREYVSAMPEQGWSDPHYPSRSEAEQAIVATLVRAGASDGQIIEFADNHLAKHIEKAARGDDAYLRRMIDGGRKRLYEEFGLINHPDGGFPRKREAKYRWTPGGVYEAALDLVAGQTVTEWLRLIQEGGIAKQRSSYRIRRSTAQARSHHD